MFAGFKRAATPKSLGVVLVAAAIGCTTVTVQKDPGPHNHGIRYWRPKPYLFIGPYGGPQPTPNPAPPLSPNTGKGVSGGGAASDPTGQGSSQSPGATQLQDNIIKVSMEIKYLPDYNEEYSIRLRPGIGLGSLSLNLQDGWNLTSVNMQTDQKLPELLTAIGGLLPKLPGASTGGGGPTKGGAGLGGAGDEGQPFLVVDARPDVPLGFYEPIIATEPTGRKSLFGWRYVGFMPFAGCPVTPCIESQVVTCSEADLYGIVATPTSIKFARLSEIQNPTSNQNWPYRYKKYDQPPYENGIAPPPAPPAGSSTDNQDSDGKRATNALIDAGVIQNTKADQLRVTTTPITPKQGVDLEGVVGNNARLVRCDVKDDPNVYYVAIQGIERPKVFKPTTPGYAKIQQADPTRR